MIADVRGALWIAAVCLACGQDTSKSTGGEESGSSSTSTTTTTSTATESSSSSDNTTNSTTTTLPEPPEGCSWTPQGELHCFDDPIAVVGSEGLDPGGTGDFDGDGNIDLWGRKSSELVVLFGHGDGTFEPPLQLSAILGAHGVGDFDGDGKDDLLADAVREDDLSELWLGDSQLAFTGPTEVPGAGGAWIGDLDDDTNLDLVLMPEWVTFEPPDTTPGRLQFLWGDGTGAFETGAVLDYSPESVGGPLGGDLDGDGIVDLFTTSGNGMPHVFKGLGNREFEDLGEMSHDEAPENWTGIGDRGNARLVHDYDGDGRGELAWDCQYDWQHMVSVATLLGPTTVRFFGGEYWVWSGDSAPDYNADGLADLVMDSFGLVLLWGKVDDEGFSFADGHDLRDPSPDFVTGADFDNDGRLDLVYYTDQFIVMLAREP